ncbi:MAG: hypothetical protein NTV98_03305 [Candidatus Roizmanbacteria bacterium]|nr:hypothetical protein [Candidatus Roizmanbacteria bacterium]
MKLPFINNNNVSGEVYCGILLKEAQGICFVYEKKPHSVFLLKQKEFQYSDGWEHIVDDIDEALSIIEQEMGKQTIISQCVFFVFAHLIDQVTHEIAKPYITKLRDISKLLELKPVGYMEVIDAVHEELETEKQTRLSSIVVELDDTQITTFLFKGGHKIAIQHSSRTDNFAEDMQGSLEKIAQSHILPNHIYLYDSTDLAEESSDLLLYSWKKNLFIQQPRIAVVSSSTVSKALLKLLEKQLCEQPQVIVQKEEANLPKEVMGFTIGGEVVEENIVEETSKPKSTFRFSLPKIKLPSFSFSRATPFIAIPLLVVGICFSILYFLHRANIVIKVPIEKKSAEITIQASKKPTKTDQVELQTVTTSFSATEKKDTTGKRDIGEKAAGEVTLYSYEEKEKQLPKATKLQQDSLSYETDDAITIPASQFASDGITKNPGKAKIKVRASILGTESNIDKNKRFSVAGSSSSIVFGINEAALTGGTKKVVRTISKTDMDNIRSFVLDKAKKDAIDKQKTDTSFILLPELSVAKANKEQFSGEVGEEADSLKYTASGEVAMSRIPKKTIQDFVEKKLVSEKPAGYKTETVTFSVKNQKKLENGDMQFTIGGEILFVKSLNATDIAKTAVGKGGEEGKTIIQSQFGVTEVELSINPALPFIQDRMPFWQDHIRVELLR